MIFNGTCRNTERQGNLFIAFALQEEFPLLLFVLTELAGNIVHFIDFI